MLIATPVHQAYSMPVLDTDVKTAKDMFEVNFFGVLRVTQAFSDMVIAAKGKIVNLSSIVGVFPNSMTGKSKVATLLKQPLPPRQPTD